VILRSPDKLTDVDPDTENHFERKYTPEMNYIAQLTKKVTGSMERADCASLIDLEDYSRVACMENQGESRLALLGTPTLSVM